MARKLLGIVLSLAILFTLHGCKEKSNLADDISIVNEAAQSDVILLAGLSKSAIAESGYGEIAYRYLNYIQDALPGRIKNTQREREAAVFIVSALLDMGYAKDSIQVQSFKNDYVEYQPTDGIFDGGERTETSQNVILTKKGDSDKVLIIGAHYDSVGTHGINDNGSGVSVVLENAMRMFDIQTPYTLRYIFFGSEESRQKGSNYYVESLSWREKRKIVAMVNFDCILAGETLYMFGGKFKKDGSIANDWAACQASEFAAELGLDIRWQQPKSYEMLFDSGFTRGGTDYLPATITAMESYAAQNGHVIDISDTRRHHEIYISDPRKTAPEKLKTVIRHPISRGV